MKLLAAIVALLFTTVVFAQKTDKDYADVDQYAISLGAMEALNVAIIADTLTRKFTEKEQKARAIYCWIANNIAMDPKAIKSNDTKKNDPVLVIQTRKATSLGFALLVQEMCSMANIRCLTVDGYTRYNTEDINNAPDQVNHSWNVVQLGKSPEQWHYVDAAKASGYMDKKQSTFFKKYTGRYFFTDRFLFNLDHFADNSAWQLGEGPKGLKDFYALPVISHQAYSVGLKKITPVIGTIRGNMNNPVNFTFKHDGSYDAKSMEILIGEENKKPVKESLDFSDDGVQITFRYAFKRDDEYPVKILVDGEVMVMFMAIISE